MFNMSTLGDDIAKHQLQVSWTSFIVMVGNSKGQGYAYHSRPTHITEMVICKPNECSCRNSHSFTDLYKDPSYVHMVPKQRKLGKDEACPIDLHKPDAALYIAWQDWMRLYGNS